MYKFLATILIGWLLFPLAHADIIELEQSDRSLDRIDQLTMKLATGSYGNESEGSENYRENLDPISNKDSQQNQEPFPLVFQEHYRKLGITTLYPDSQVKYSTEGRTYFEIKKFKNNVLMVRDIESDIVTFSDLDVDDSASKSWNISCSVDQITDEKICMIYKFGVRIMKSSKLGVLISVTGDTEKLNTRQYQYLRVDKNPAFKTHSLFTGNDAIKIISQMKNGSMAYTRFYEWSDSYEESLSLYGFSAAYQTMNLMFQRLE
ncbi:hypothetical protein GFH30_04965 [Acinetobacter wanghuae]|uniref:Uncharacterized protein n=1 Tax=Acinetobacter wanghuae TaxID=2662362 RepID=A0A5Q0P3Z2_9GAMM|nr:hypothetical protein [Acinetobacter wanghuae]MQW93379.1 hypothetical protein [Acinetobacter wanghuae]QGA10781.1 hypothetical protein GFH30_04965 [Acinetobacter wanghuae]